MLINNNAKNQICELTANTAVNKEVFILSLVWNEAVPKAGQFFMIRPKRSSSFLARPISIFEFNPVQRIVKFLISIKGKVTSELAEMQSGEKIELTGPFGNSWSDFLPETGKAALVGGSCGVAPLAALVAEKPDYDFTFYAGFKSGFREKNEENMMLGAASLARKVVITAEDGRNALSGLIIDYIFDVKEYDIVLTCGPQLMMDKVYEKCAAFSVPCFMSLERKFVCGAGVCLGCTVRTKSGNKRCCTDGPIFAPQELI